MKNKLNIFKDNFIVNKYKLYKMKLLLEPVDIEEIKKVCSKKYEKKEY